METFTIREAAERTGRTEKAIRNLCDRGKLRYVLRDGRRRIIALDLDALPQEAAKEAGMRQRQPEAASEAVVALVARLEAQAVELAALRALTVEAESLRAHGDRLEADLLEARSTITALEARLAQRRGIWPFRRAA